MFVITTCPLSLVIAFRSLQRDKTRTNISKGQLNPGPRRGQEKPGFHSMSSTGIIILIVIAYSHCKRPNGNSK